MHHRMEHIRPNMHLPHRSSDGHISVFQMKRLAEITPAGKRIGGKPDTETSLLQQRVVLIKRTAATQIEEDIIILYPHIHTDISSAARHGAG